jgi:hypothetical protein
MAAFTLLHVVISLIGIGTGFVVLYGFLTSNALRRWTQAFLLSSVATNATGFGFPLRPFLPSHVVAILSLVVLALCIYALYGRSLVGVWRAIYVITAVIALYFNVFVLIVQLFRRVPALTALAPTQSEPPFAIAQGLAFAVFVVLGVMSVRRFRPGTNRGPTGHVGRRVIA